MGQNISKILHSLIRPPRTRYHIIQGTRYYSDGTKSKSGRIFGLSYTYYQPINHQITLIYLHCNSSSQLEGRYLQSYLSCHNIALFLFDFEGCGNSDGDFISLGIKQAEQIFKITQYIRTLNNNKIILWGRSMGATAVIRYLQMYGEQNILCSIVDSPFKKLRDVVYHFIKFLPNFMIQPLYRKACLQCFPKIGYNLENFQVGKQIDNIDCPILFIASKNDQIVPFQQSKELYNKINHNRKKLIEISQTHNEQRSHEVTLQCIRFINNEFIDTSQNDSRISQSRKMKFSKVVYRMVK